MPPQFAPEIRVELPGVRLGAARAEGVRVELVVPELAREMDAVCDRLRRALTVEQVAQLDSVRAVRAMFRAWGMDPSKYRPSSEALLRRVTQGKGLYRVSNVVDIINLCSIETSWPYGLYDLAHVRPPILFRLGCAGETYEGIGKQTWHLHDRPVLVDSLGPFGSPISDSTRTMITESARSILTIIFAPAATADAPLQHALDLLCARLRQFASAQSTDAWFVQPC
jgi:DNA/RNA-binding domain of Phe-tRNA-synthetase-like protein